MDDRMGADPVAIGPATARRATAGEKAVLILVVAIAGGALAYAVFLASGGSGVVEVPRGDVMVVSKGDPVDLAAAAVKGKYTIFDFYADWCPPCRALDPELRMLAARHENVAIRKIDIIDWTTPVVQQHGVEDLPHMVLYGPDGKMIASGDDVYLAVQKLFDTAL